MRGAAAFGIGAGIAGAGGALGAIVANQIDQCHHISPAVAALAAAGGYGIGAGIAALTGSGGGAAGATSGSGGLTGAVDDVASAVADDAAAVADDAVAAVADDAASNLDDAANAISDYLGPNATAEIPESGSDLILRSADGTKQIRFDLTNPHGLDPHINVETFRPRNLFPGDKRMIQTSNEHIFPKL